MAAPLCACGQPSPGAVICKTCTRGLQLTLITAASLGPDLEAATARQARFTGPGRRAGGSVLPFDERASAAASALRNVLAGWVRVLSERNQSCTDAVSM